MTNAEKVHEFLNKAQTFYFLTTDGDQPKGRPFGFQMLVNDTLYFGCGTFKNVFKQLTANPKVEILAVNGGEFLRYDGEAKVVKDAALLEKVKGAYHTDPLDAHVIGAVSQYVMTLKGGFSLAFWKPSVAPERELWSAALLKRAEDADDPYVKQFCLDQLRWCGLNCQAAAVAAIGEQSSDKGVKDLAYIASKELSR